MSETNARAVVALARRLYEAGGLNSPARDDLWDLLSQQFGLFVDLTEKALSAAPHPKRET